MSVKDFTANVISATPIVPDGNFTDNAASGVWDLSEQFDLVKVITGLMQLTYALGMDQGQYGQVVMRIRQLILWSMLP